MEAIVARDALNRSEFRPLNLRGEDAARIHETAIQDDGAGTAVAVVASLFRTGQSESLAQHFEQTLARLA
jgi:hypothetical protein